MTKQLTQYFKRNTDRGVLGSGCSPMKSSMLFPPALHPFALMYCQAPVSVLRKTSIFILSKCDSFLACQGQLEG